MASGVVKTFNWMAGFGSITPDSGGLDVFVHVSSVEASGMRTLVRGQRLTFDIERDLVGLKAVNLRTV